MSHFTVLVVGDDVEEQLAPFHEFECTGVDDEYVKDIDKTEEAKKEFAEDTTRRYKDPEGNLHDPYEDRFYREFTDEEKELVGPCLGSGSGHGLSWHSKDWDEDDNYRAKVHFVPEGWEEVEVPTRDVKSFSDFAEDWYGYKAVPLGTEPDLAGEHKYGYVLVDENGDVTKVVNRTNPNYKWDWYQVGGRWSGLFRLKPGTEGEVGAKGVLGLCCNDSPEYADQALKGDIDFDYMRQTAREEAEDLYDAAVKATVGVVRPTWNSWEELLESVKDVNKARDAYHEHPYIEALKEVDSWDPCQFLVSRDTYVEQAERNAVKTFAILKDGKWYERGDMGWWGCVSDVMDSNDWDELYFQLLESIPDDTLLTVVDCHI